jgi:hypothetical protein
MRYVPHQHNLNRKQRNAATIQKLLAREGLSDYARGFLFGIQHHKPLAYQQKLLDQLEAQILHQGVNRNSNEASENYEPSKRLAAANRST